MVLAEVLYSKRYKTIIGVFLQFSLPAVILLSGVLSGASVLESAPTYEHRDPSTGETLTCSKCPPGTHMAAHCSATKSTECAPCRDDHFTALWNYLPRCLYCNNFCAHNQEVERECSATSNRVCRCKQGFYWTGYLCVRHSECGPGYGVKTAGTEQTDTICEECAEGFFSSASSALDSCVGHQECATGQITLLNCSIYHNTVCGTCNDFANAGETYKTFLSGFFHGQSVRITKIRKFVNRCINKGEGRVRGVALSSQRGVLLDQIRTWLSQASKMELKTLPEVLSSTGLCPMAEKLKRALRDIGQRNPNCLIV
ncbi:tumor necrosis factor receptor superfamily member 6B-like [Antennarius striatus]|uniref:tumor necrosis factor receptor superfamily member 6B-like n=1 Tax=Antennarius striatus TaxID=241820 RepID=UPI0035AE4B75